VTVISEVSEMVFFASLLKMCLSKYSVSFSERVINVLPANVDFSSLRSFTRTVKLADLSVFLKCFN